MSILSDVHAEDWQDRRDPDGAVATARALFGALRDGAQDPVIALDAMEIAVEPLWDHEDGDPSLVLAVAAAMQPAFVDAVRFGGLKDPARLLMRVRPTVLLMRAQHRVSGHEREALLTALGLLTFLEDYVGGADALIDVIGRPTANPVAEAAVALLGLYPAALRRADLPPTVREQYRGIGMRLVRAYVESAGLRVLYPRAGALASQWLYLAIEERRPREASLVHALYALDLAARPQHLRGQATRAQRDAAYAKYCGDGAGFARNRDDALRDLELYRLVRHQAVVERFGYLAA